MRRLPLAYELLIIFNQYLTNSSDGTFYKIYNIEWKQAQVSLHLEILILVLFFVPTIYVLIFYVVGTEISAL